MYRFDEGAVAARLGALEWPRPAAFAAACAQRLRTGYQHYVHASGQGDPGALDEALGALWESLAGRPEPGDLERLADRCEELVPDLLKEWSTEGQYAEDALAAAAYGLRGAARRDAWDAMLPAKRGFESVDAILQYELDFDYSQPGESERMLDHPLIQAELARQERDLAHLEAASPQTLPDLWGELRARAEAEPIHP